MARVAVLGMGLLGRGFAENLIAKGHSVSVWNRTASKCEGIAGARVASSPSDAVKGAERVHLVLSEDHAVDAVIDAFKPGLGDGVPVVDHSTNAPAKVEARVKRLAGVRYLHAPVFMGPSNSKDATGLMMVSGDPGLVEALVPALSTMTGKVMQVGAEPSKAAKLKLAGNGLLIGLTGIMGDLFAMGRGSDLSAEDVLELFGTLRPTAVGMGQRVLAAGTTPPSFELTMARKDVRLMIEAAGDEPLIVLPGIAAAMDEAIEAGKGAQDFAIVAAGK